MKRKILTVILSSMVLVSVLFSCTGFKQIKKYDISGVEASKAACIKVPIDIEIESIDGREVKGLSSAFFSSGTELLLPPGGHEITVRYSDFWEYDENNYDKFESDDVILGFTAEPGMTYRLAHPKLEDSRDMAEFADQPDIWIEKTGSTGLTAEKKQKSSKVSKKIEETDYEYKKVYKKPSSAKKSVSLKDDWDKMSEEEKEKFREWLKWNSMSREEKEKFREWSKDKD